MRLSLSLKRKLLAVCIATGLFVLLAIPFTVLLRAPLDQTIVGAFLLGLFISAFEEFYVHGHHGRGLRSMHPLKSIAIYSTTILVAFFVVLHLVYLLFGRISALPEAYARLPVSAPLMLLLAIAAVMVLRVVGFLGARNLYFLIIGKYYRPVIERKVFLFLDIKGSTGLVERLGPVNTRAMIGKFFFDISKPITDHGGDIYRFTGDGVVATWDWEVGLTANRIVAAIDDVWRAVDAEAAGYRSTFGHVPEFRIGVHGGEIVTSEEGDIKRAIGFYGDTIHIAARMEQKAKEVGRDCLITEDIARGLTGLENRLNLLSQEPVRGITRPIGIYELTKP